MKKKGFIACAAAAALLLAGIVFLCMYRPEKTEEQKPTADPKPETEVLTIDSADEITVKTAELDIRYICEDGNWRIDGAENISASKLATFVSEALSYTTETLIEGRAPEECGLDAPALTVTISGGEKTHTVLVGDKSAVDDAYFASADGVIFTMPGAKYETLTHDIEYYRTFTRVAVNAENITEVKLERGGEVIDIYLPELTRYEGNVWRMRTPYDTLASDDFMDSDVLGNIAAISLSQPAQELGTVRARLTVTEGGDSVYVFDIGRTDGGSVYVAYNGGVYREPAELFGFVDAELFSYVNKLVSYVHINDISSCTAEFDGRTHRLEVSGTDKSLKFKADGKEKEADLSRKMYAEIIGVVASGLYNSEPMGDTVMKVSFKGRDGAPDTELEYKKINEYTAAAVKNGQAIFAVPLSDISALKEKITEYFK